MHYPSEAVPSGLISDPVLGAFTGLLDKYYQTLYKNILQLEDLVSADRLGGTSSSVLIENILYERGIPFTQEFSDSVKRELAHKFKDINSKWYTLDGLNMYYNITLPGSSVYVRYLLGVPISFRYPSVSFPNSAQRNSVVVNPAIYNGNLLTNGGFENYTGIPDDGISDQFNGIVSTYGTTGSTVEATSINTHNEMTGCLLNSVDTNGCSVEWDNIPVRSSTTYSFSVWTYQLYGTGGLQLQVFDQGGNYLYQGTGGYQWGTSATSIVLTTGGGTGGWNLSTVVFNTFNNQSPISVRIINNGVFLRYVIDDAILAVYYGYSSVNIAPTLYHYGVNTYNIYIDVLLPGAISASLKNFYTTLNLYAICDFLEDASIVTRFFDPVSAQITVSNGTSVTGVGTTFTTQFNVSNSLKNSIGINGVTYQIASVNSDTSLTLSDQSVNGTFQKYWIPE